MPHSHLRDLREALDGVDRNPVQSAELTNIALVHALRSQTDVLQRIVDHQDKFDTAVTEIRGGVHSIDKRLAVIENGSLDRGVSRNTERIGKLETDVGVLKTAEAKREGAAGLVSYISSNWGLLVAIGAALVLAALKFLN